MPSRKFLDGAAKVNIFFRDESHPFSLHALALLFFKFIVSTMIVVNAIAIKITISSSIHTLLLR